MTVPQFMALLKEKMGLLHMDGAFAQRYLNLGFSGGEKKKSEMLQLAVLEPSIALLDETDSGLDVDALRVVAVDGLESAERRVKVEVRRKSIDSHAGGGLRPGAVGRVERVESGRSAGDVGATRPLQVERGRVVVDDIGEVLRGDVEAGKLPHVVGRRIDGRDDIPRAACSITTVRHLEVSGGRVVVGDDRRAVLHGAQGVATLFY